MSKHNAFLCLFNIRTILQAPLLHFFPSSAALLFVRLLTLLSHMLWSFSCPNNLVQVLLKILQIDKLCCCCSCYCRRCLFWWAGSAGSGDAAAAGASTSCGDGGSGIKCYKSLSSTASAAFSSSFFCCCFSSSIPSLLSLSPAKPPCFTPPLRITDPSTCNAPLPPPALPPWPSLRLARPWGTSCRRRLASP